MSNLDVVFYAGLVASCAALMLFAYFGMVVLPALVGAVLLTGCACMASEED